MASLDSPPVALEAIPPLVPAEGDDDPLGAYGPVISGMFKTGHPKWGFLIYRASYEDDDAWQRFLDILDRRIQSSLYSTGKTRPMPHRF